MYVDLKYVLNVQPEIYNIHTTKSKEGDRIFILSMKRPDDKPGNDECHLTHNEMIDLVTRGIKSIPNSVRFIKG